MAITSRVLPFPSPAAPRAETAHNLGGEALLGPSPAIARVWSQIRRVAPHFRAALVTGEPGCGAEAVGRALHVLSPVNQLPFAAFDAAHADQALRATANATHHDSEGLIFLEDLERLSPELQRSLLRKLRVRGNPLRLVGSASTDLRACVSAGRFSAELAEAVTAIRIALPSLRDRKEDIPLLADHITQRTAAKLGNAAPTLDATFHEAACAFAWPGNLRQLQSMLLHLLSHDPPALLTAAHFQAATTAIEPTPIRVEPASPRMIPLEDVVQEHIRSVLVACHGNKLRAAEILGISRSTLYRMLDSVSGDPALPLAG